MALHEAKKYHKPALYTGTGEQAMLDVRPGHTITMAITAGASDDYDIEVVLSGDDSGTRHKVIEGLSGNVIKEITGPVTQVGLDIDASVSATIQLEVRVDRR